MCWLTFFVRAETPNPLLFFDTEPDCGYSVDNLAPGVPGNLRFQNPTLRAWDESGDADFDYFAIYGSTDAGLDSTAVLIGHTTGTTRDISGTPFLYYHVTATDFSGNEGDAASLEDPGVSGVGETAVLPARFALRAIVPNPTARGAVVSFDLPKDGHVDLKIYDASGRLVATLIDGETPAGARSIVWPGVDARGSRVSTGVYFCRMEAPGFSAARKVIIAL
jgi:hypothetical protein